MKITFVGIGTEQLAISQLSSILKKDGHEVTLAFSYSLFNDRYNLTIPTLSQYFDDTDEVINKIKKINPHLVAFSCLTSTYQWMLKLSKKIKLFNPQIKIIFGGVHPSAVPEVLIKEESIDYVCIGEGDHAILDVCKIINLPTWNRPIGNIWFKDENKNIIRGKQESFIKNINDLPYFDKDLWHEQIRVGDLYLTMASRGCPFRCTFCFNNFFATLPEDKGGKYVRQRSVEHMMGELIEAKKKFSLKVVAFEDDIFTVNKKWLREFLTEYKKEINLPFQCLTHPSYIDRETSSLLYNAGCKWIQMGVQTLDEELKFKNLKRYEKNRQVELALESMLKENLKPKIDHMFGLPGEKVEYQSHAFDVYKKFTPKRIQTFWTTLLPGTEIIDEALKLNLISIQEIEDLNNGKGFNFHESNIKILDKELSDLYTKYEFLFKVLPLLPAHFRKKFNLNSVKYVPVFILSRLGFLIDGFFGLIYQNPEHNAYFKHYLYSLPKVLFLLFKIKWRKFLNKVNDSASLQKKVFLTNEKN